MNLIIVESPTKSKTLKGFLGKEYEVLATKGHIRDLPKSKLGIDIENNFEPQYVIPTKARKTVSQLKKEAEKAERVVLATDADREGEAIAWHLAQILNLGEIKNQSFDKLRIDPERSRMGQKSFTLVELLVAVAIFAIIGGIASGVFVSALRAQRKSLAYQELLSQTSYLMEYMSRALRMARKDIDGVCIDAKLNYKKVDSGIKFMNYKGECQKFYLSGSQLKEEKAGIISNLTSTGLSVSNFNINLLGQTQDDNLQPRATFFLDITGKEQSKIKIQTAVSQRSLDIER